ncbi:MAG: ATP-dependent 6-phosphofructokinase [Elusimicrobiota bacterium]
MTAKKTIAVITTGGDAPGMNAAIRSVVRSAIHSGFKVIGFKRGWRGLIEKDYMNMESRTVSNIIGRGGTILYTDRCPLFKKKKYRRQAAFNLEELSPAGLVVIGGDGSMNAAYMLTEMTSVPVIGIPASIDNDIAGTDETVGFDTAINTALESIDKIRDTATSHRRIFIVEVMGRDRGFLAVNIGLASGAEIILIPEKNRKKEKILEELIELKNSGKSSILIIMAEGAGDADKLAHYIGNSLSVPVRISKLGYIQRGGAPTVDSRLLASLFGFEAIKLLKKKKSGVMITWVKEELGYVPLSYPHNNKKELNMQFLDIARVLSG